MTMPFRRLSYLVLVAALATSLAACADEPEVRYRRDILPLLSDRCFQCHGPDSASRQAGLRLDRTEDAYAELESGLRAIVPNTPDESAVLERIETDDPDFAMPPADSGKSLNAEEKALIRRWIESGAEYEPHWAFVAPSRPAVPRIRHEELARNPIDAFVLAKLEAEGIEPAPRATAERLIRRLSFDLIGLPPTLEEIDTFIADDSSQGYERVVDRLFASKHYGERMAAEWLDGAHYADSNGYQNDFARNMWPWRDWVINAFNRNMPYDQFLVEQLAGDMLPDATIEQRIATGFCRNNRTVTEAGSIDEEWLVENVVDRTETMGAMFLGLTVGCARCHDHKFDPISQRDFYQLFAFFNNVAEKGFYEETRGNVAPLLRVISKEQQLRLDEFDQQIKKISQLRIDASAKFAPHRKRWVVALASADESTEPVAVTSIDLRDGAVEASSTVAGTKSSPTNSVTPEWRDGPFGRTAAFTGKEVLPYPTLNFPPPDRPFSWSVWVKPDGDGAIFSKMDDDDAYRGCDLLLLGDSKASVHLIHAWPDNVIKVFTKQPLDRNRWTHVAVTYDGSKKAAGVVIYFDGKPQEVDVEADRLTNSFATDQPFRVGRRSNSSSLHAAITGARLFSHALTAQEVSSVMRGSLAQAMVGVNPDQFDSATREQFDTLMLAHWDDPAIAEAVRLTNELRETHDNRRQFDESLPTTMVMEERAEPRSTFVLQRGQYNLPDKSQQVLPDVPDVLPPLAADAPRNRLGLARWLTDRANPLTARVAVNRLWQQFFGLGLVKTPDNFGVQSEAPSHPELLDWLATELIESDWDIQHIQRLIVESYVYQQSSEVAAAVYEHDPENRLLARGPRYRLPAEGVRDNALAVSGLLVPKVGGASVMPYQPPGLWEELAGGAFEVYTQGHGDDLYRRSLYVYRKRTVPHPAMATFDAPSWEICQVKRSRTNTPLQALALLNDVVYVEAARKLAERMLQEGGTSADSRLTFAFRLATGRTPSENELAVLSAGLAKQLQRYRMEPNAAEQLVANGEAARAADLDTVELAAYTAIASVVLNLDETVSKN